MPISLVAALLLAMVGTSFVSGIFGMAGGMILMGILLALLRGSTPAILMPGVLYGVIAMAGSLLYVAVEPASSAVAAIACVGLVVVARFAAVRWGLQTRPLPLVATADDEDPA